MKIFILLFFILITLILTARIEISIKKLQIINKKIKFNIRFNIYALKKIKIFSKKVSKKDIIKIINYSEIKKHLKKEEKFLNYLDINLKKINLEINYGGNNVVANSYLFGIINSIIPTIISKYSNEKTEINYCINTEFKKNIIDLQLQSIIFIDIFNSLKKLFKNLVDRI